ncbi:hypothetical protein VR010_02920 [Actinomycetaceae bacterium L2_0104]
MGLKNVVSAEAGKLRTLPAVTMTAIVTVTGSIVIAGALANSASSSALETVIQMVPFLQLGPILLGILAFTQEYTGSQMSTTLRATPNRARLLAGKTTALAAAQVALAVLVILTARCTAGIFGQGESLLPRVSEVKPLAGVAAYLVCAGMISYGIALLARSLAASLVASLSLLLLLPPLLVSVTTYAHWLPSEAGRSLYIADSASAGQMLTPWQAIAALAVWVALALAAGSGTLIRRDG